MIWTDSSVIFWTLLSVFDLTIDEQLTVIGKLPDKKFKDPHITNLYLFSCSLNTYLRFWIDEFDFLYNEIEDKPSEIYINFFDLTDDITFKDCLLVKDFVNGYKWNSIRELGKEILLKSDLGALEIVEPFIFDEYVRVYLNDSGHIRWDH